MHRITVVGGGFAGLTTAVTAAGTGARVTVYKAQVRIAVRAAGVHALGTALREGERAPAPALPTVPAARSRAGAPISPAREARSHLSRPRRFVASTNRPHEDVSRVK
jgi:flavin-dependent dehydrogenase